MSLTSSMNIAQQALSVSQAAITVVSNNIANIDTPGYSKLRANEATVSTSFDSASQSPIQEADSFSGVELASITRYSNAALQSYYDQENSTYSYLSQYSSTASEIESVTNQLNNTGLSTAISNFYTAANTLNNDPSDITARTNYVSTAQTLCSQFNSISSSLTTIQKTLVGDATSNSASDMASEVANVNSLIDQLATVNQNILKTNSSDGTSSPSLLDQRDSLVTQISSLVNVNTEINKNGTVNVSLGDYRLVKDGGVIGHLKATNSTNVSGNLVTTISIVDPANSSKTLINNVNGEITGGSIGAILDVCGTNPAKLTINGVLGNLNTMANEFASVMNSIQTTANYPVGSANGTPMAIDGTTMKLTTTTVAMFLNSSTSTTAGITAGNISVNTAIMNDPYKVAAARLVDTTKVDSIGNNSNMTLVIDARSDSSYYSALGGVTPEQYLASTVSSVGAQVSNINNNLATQKAVTTQIKTNLSSQTGVNLDEELGDLIKYQRAYQAAARVFSTCNDMLNTLMNLGQ